MALEGVAQLTRQLRELGIAAQGRALRTAVRAGIKPAHQRAKATIPTGSRPHRTYRGRLVAPGFSSRSLRVITRLSRDKEKAEALLGVRKEAFYATQFVELGTSKMPARPWLRPAFEATLAEQQAGLAAGLRKGLLRAARAR